MSADNNNIAKPNENQNETKTVDKSRRSFAKIGAAAPVIMTLTSKAALGSVYQCTISGVQSGNTSSHGSIQPDCGVGISPGGWWQNASKSSRAAGNTKQWLLAGINPFSIKYEAISPNTTKVKQIKVKGNWILAINGTSDKWSDVYNVINNKFGTNALATTFASKFGSGSTDSFWDVLDQAKGNGNTDANLEWHAIPDYLNALLFAAGGASAFASVYAEVSASDIVNLYKLAKGGPNFTSSSGTLITGNFNGGTSGSGVLAYLVSIHH